MGFERLLFRIGKVMNAQHAPLKLPQYRLYHWTQDRREDRVLDLFRRTWR